MSNSSMIKLWAMCQAISGWFLTVGTGRGPQPSSADLKLLGAANGECRDNVLPKRRGMIVEYQGQQHQVCYAA